MNGGVARAAGSRVNLDLAPYESRVLVFSKDRVEERPAPRAQRRRRVDLNSGWQVTFDGSPQPVADARRSTRGADDEAHKYFSGRATYEKTVTVPDWKGRQVWLNFGEGAPGDGRRDGDRATACGPCSRARCARPRWST